MRAKIAGLIVLMGIMALTTGFSPQTPVKSEDSGYGRLTDDQSECLVGGTAACFSEASEALATCVLESGATDLENVDLSTASGCVGRYVEAFVGCVIGWILSFIF